MEQFDRLIEAAKRGEVENVRSIVQSGPELINDRDEHGATALHYAAFGGHRDVVLLLIKQGADINARDKKYNATPTGWAIEYLRELGGLLTIELSDFAYAIQRGDVDWSSRFLSRFPRLREASDIQGTPFKQLAVESRNPAILSLFESK